ncbi:hypothetical protein L6164_005944 [Bauhinia variegata]|uniref:Uncharacterized protein n=1 Tax=Bauhinia variegata TaxID=167791 RepID=A0ACB9PS08_BAUVA|nr:hypothetical protein L6164_005944 [Bauhinia variegata]
MAAIGINRVALIFLATVAITIPCFEAGVVNYDDFLLKQEEEARRAALEAYHPFPYNVTSELNLHVHLALQEHEKELKGMNISTRRDLGSKKMPKGPCTATNPIDRCWRCNPNWADDRFKLVSCAMGFGKKTTGGLGGPIYVVTDPSDDDMLNPKPGTLRHAVIQEGPLWITFEHNMVIKLQQELLITSHKTIDGRGANVQIKGGAGLSIFKVQNVIVHNIRIKSIKAASGGIIADSVNHQGLRTRSDGDAISIFTSSNIWIDHISMSDCEDGLVDIIAGSTGVTISNCHMTHHNDVMLFGANDQHTEDKIMQMYAIGGSSAPTILSQGNRFIAPMNDAAKLITHRDYAPESVWSKWQWRSEMDLLMNGAQFIESGEPLNGNYPGDRANIVEPKDGQFVTTITKYSGALSCKVGKPC